MSIARARLVLSVLMFIVFAAQDASADEADARTKSRLLFLDGVAALADTRPEDGLRFFSRAYELYPHYATLYNIGICHRALGHHADAAIAFQRFLDDGASQVSKDERARVTALIDEILPRTAVITVDVRPHGRATVDGRAVNGDGIRVDPGAHVAEASESGMRSDRSTVVVTAGERKAVAFALVPLAAASQGSHSGPQDAPARALPPTRFNTAFWATAAVAGAGIVTFAVSGGLALSSHAAYEKAASDDEASRERGRGKDLALVADVGLIVAVVSGAIATVIALRPIDSARPSAVTRAESVRGTSPFALRF